MTLCNLHTHTDRSDGTSPAETVVLIALEKGLRTLGFSDHVHTPWLADDTLPQDLGCYISENMRLAQVFHDRIEIVCGLENEFDCWQSDDRLQYVIGSRHSISFGDRQFLIDETPEDFAAGIREFYGGDVRAAVTDYYRHLTEDYPRYRPDIIGHLDLVRKFNTSSRFFDENAGWYRAAALEAAESAGETGAVFEVNTSNIARKRRRILYPADFILRFILERGYPVMLSSDSHDPSLLDGAFGTAADRLREIGFRSITVWKDGGFKTEALTAY